MAINIPEHMQGKVQHALEKAVSDAKLFPAPGHQAMEPEGIDNPLFRSIYDAPLPIGKLGDWIPGMNVAEGLNRGAQGLAEGNYGSAGLDIGASILDGLDPSPIPWSGLAGAGMGAIKSLKGAGAIDVDMLPQRIKDIGGSDRWDYLQKNPAVHNEFVDFEIKPSNLPDDIETYYGNTFKGNDRSLRYIDPKYADVNESVGDEFLTRWPVLRENSGLVDEIPISEGDNMLYRGISFEEMEDIRKTGFIQSKGDWNLGGEQIGTTSFSTDPGSAAHYAGGFAPSEHKPVFGRHSYVVGIKDPGTAVDIEALRGSHERSIPGSISADEIISLHEGVAYGIEPGKADIRMGHGGEYPSGHSGVDPQSQIGWRDIIHELDELISGKPK